MTYLKKFGSILNGDYLKIKPDGTLRQYGDSTAWDDMVADLFSRRLNSTAGKVDYEWSENALKFQSGGSIDNVVDRVQGNLQIGHKFRVGVDIDFHPHVHWFQSDGTTDFTLTLRYRVQKNNAVKTASWTDITLSTATDGVFTYPGSGDFNQISVFPTITVTCDISDTFQFQLARTDSLTGDMLVYFFDIHGEIDSLGSDDSFHKYG